MYLGGWLGPGSVRIPKADGDGSGVETLVTSGTTSDPKHARSAIEMVGGDVLAACR